MVQLHFLPARTVKFHLKTKREIQLDDSDARSHAAKVSHYHPRQGHVGRHKPSTVKRRLPAPSPLSVAAVHSGSLDPFFPTPLALDSQERQLLHIYLKSTPSTVYGLGSNPVYCPIRDAVAAEIATNALVVRWVLYLSSVSSGAPATAVLARRAGIYTEMMQILRSPTMARLHSTLMVLLAAGIAENRSGNITLAYKHYAGALALLRGYQGGLSAVQRMDFAKAMGVIEGVLMQHVPLFESKMILLEAVGRLRMPRARVAVDRRLWKFFGSDLAGLPEREVAFHIANLHLASMMLEDGKCERFMEELVRMVLGGGKDITPNAVTIMICASSVRIGEWYGEAPKLKSWETLEFVRLIMLTTKLRERVVRAMSENLLGRSQELFDLDGARQEIEEGWKIMSRGTLALSKGKPIEDYQHCISACKKSWRTPPRPI